MGKYMIKASYSTEGVQGLMQAGGTSRVHAVEKALAGVGGTIESFYFAFGADDVFVVVDGIDNAGALAMAGAISSSPALRSYETTVLLTPAEVDQAMDATVEYAPPGS
jgi:uncharacterized protein with GYD domain